MYSKISICGFKVGGEVNDVNPSCGCATRLFNIIYLFILKQSKAKFSVCCRRRCGHLTWQLREACYNIVEVQHDRWQFVISCKRFWAAAGTATIESIRGSGRRGPSYSRDAIRIGFKKSVTFCVFVY